MAPFPPWSTLPSDLLEQIFLRLHAALDLFRCCNVCVSWQSVASLLFSYPLLLIHNPKYEFFSFCDIFTSNNNTEEIDLPLMAQDCFICTSTNSGWLLTITLSSPYKVGLLNPISRTQIFLPSATQFSTFKQERTKGFIKKCITSVSPLDTDCIVFVIYGLDYLERKLAFCRPGDEEWQDLVDHLEEKCFLDIMFFKGKCYATDINGKIYGCDIGSNPKIVFIIEPPVQFRKRQKYLVESKSGDFLMVYRNWKWVEDEEDGISITFEVYKVDLSEREWKKIETLGDEALFIGCSNCSISDDSNTNLPRRSKIGKNCIYYIHDSVEGFPDDDVGFKCVSIYDMENRKSKRLWTSETWASQFHWIFLHKRP